MGVHRGVPAAEEEDGRERGDDEQGHVLGEVEEAETHAGVLGHVASHDLAVRLSEVEGRPVRLGRHGDEEDGEAERTPPRSEYLLKLAQPAISSPTTDSPPTAKK